MTPLERGPHSRILIPLLVAVPGIAIGVGGVVALRSLGSAPSMRQTASAAAADSSAGRSAAKARPLSDRASYARVEPSVVDVTATVRAAGETASGTGFVINPRAALVLTSNHVIRDATSVTITIPATGNRAGAGGTPASASGVISGTGRTVQASDSASGFTETLHGLIATTARIEPGDSGGPLADSAGAVIGVDTAAGTGDAAAGYAIPIDAAMAAERQILAGARGRH